MELNFFGNFEVWKLHSLSDYLTFFSYIAAGAFVFWLIVRRMNKQRDHANALVRVTKKLKRLAKRPCRIYRNATVRLPEGDMTFDAVMADKSGIFLIRVYGWGLKIYGTPDGDTWRREDQKRKEEFPNPLHELKKGANALGGVLAERGYPRVRIMPMVVFADNYDMPELYLGYGSFSTTYRELKSWYKKQAGVKEAQYDFERVAAILDELTGTQQK